MRDHRIAAVVATGALALLVAGSAAARPQRCQKVLIDAGRKYVAMIYATEHRDCTYRDGALCDKWKRRAHYVSLRGGKVPRKCSDADVVALVESDLLQWQQCSGETDQEGLGQCFLDFFEPRAESWVALIYESAESDGCKDELFAVTQRFLRAAGREEMRCRARKLRRGDHGSCADDPRFRDGVARQERRLRARACGDESLVDLLVALALGITHETIAFADDRYAY